MNRVGRFAPVLAAALSLLSMPAPARADVRLNVRTDRTSLGLDEVLTLRVEVQSEGTESASVQLPDFEGFTIVSQQVQRPMQFSFSFGAQATIRSSTIYVFGLQPLREGKLVIKPVRAELDGVTQTSRPIEITVTGSGAQAPGAQPPSGDPGQAQQPPAATGQGVDSAEIDSIAFLRTVVDKPQPFEGEQVTVTFYLYVRDRLQSNPQIEREPTTDGLWVHDLLPAQRQLEAQRQMVGNAVYTVYVLRRFAAFPLRHGTVTISPMSVVIDTSSVFDIFASGRGRKVVQRSGQPVSLEVKPLPEGRPPGDVAVGRFTIMAKLDRAQVATGDAVTLTATVQGQGHLRGIDLAAPAIEGVDVLAPEVKDLVSSQNDLVSGSREYRFLLVPRQPGRVTVPPLALDTFDPATGRYERIASPALEIEVVGQPVASKATTSPVVGSDQAPKKDEHVWAPVRTQSALRRKEPPTFARPWYLPALLAPLCAWLAVVLGSSLRRKLAQQRESGPLRAEREADQHLRSATEAARAGDAVRFHAQASSALHSLLEARLDEATSGYTHAELRARLCDRGMDEALSRELLRALERSELVRFGSGAAQASPSELASASDELRGLCDALRSFSPRQEAS